MVAWCLCLLIGINPPEPAWRDVPGVRSDDPYVDVHSRGGTYPDVHEATHQVHSRLTSLWSVGPGQTVVYCLQGRGLVLDNSPGLTLSRVAQALPEILRGEAYALYLERQAAYWDNQPWYLAIEATCYSNELEWNLRRGYEEGCSVRYSLEFCAYLLQALQLTDTADTVHARFVGWHTARTMRLLRRSQAAGWRSEAWLRYLTALRRHDSTAPLRRWAWKRVPIVAESILTEDN